MKDQNKLGNYHSLNIGDEVLVQCANSYRAVVTDINGNDIGIKVLEEPAKGSRTTAPLFALKKIKSADHNDYCPHGYDSACLICGFGTKDGERVYHTRPAVVIESMPSPMPNPYWEIAKKALDDVSQANLMRRLIEDCVGLDMPSRLSANTTTGENYRPPFKNKDEWLQALEKAQLAINSQLAWHADWPTDANFYRINVDTPIFYKYQHGQIKRWVKYAKCWVDSCIPDWLAFCKENSVQALRSWPAEKMYMQQEYGYRWYGKESHHGWN